MTGELGANVEVVNREAPQAPKQDEGRSGPVIDDPRGGNDFSFTNAIHYEFTGTNK